MRTLGPLTVHLRDQSGALHAFTPGGQVPDWAAKLMGAHCFYDEEPDVADNVDAFDSADHPGATADASTAGGMPPPQMGPEARRDLWSQYAQSNGVIVADEWKRGQIIDACRQAGVPVE